MRLLFTLFFLFTVPLMAESEKNDDLPYSLRVGAGFADFNDLQAILKFDLNHYYKDLYVINIDGGWRAAKDIFGGPIDVYLKGGLSHFNERGWADNVWEATLYVKFYGKIDFYGNRVRIGFGEGVSYAQEVLVVEQDDADVRENNGVARLLNYLDISVDVDVGRLITVDSLRDLYLGYTIKHRSGIKGLFSGVHGGSNYLMLTLEKNF